MSESLSCRSAHPKRIDTCQSMLSWLNAPNLTQTEFRHRQQIVHLRLQLLDKIDEAHYIKRCIKLRTRIH
ncbi:hypothetical protein KR054_012465 [Drosophila jambulina]|nr:hypothetical protein KR054_012465 [Drosophila jambulina]